MASNLQSHGTAQKVFRRHKQAAKEFTILHLPDTFYVGHERVMSDNLALLGNIGWSQWTRMMMLYWQLALTPAPSQYLSGQHGVLQT